MSVTLDEVTGQLLGLAILATDRGDHHLAAVLSECSTRLSSAQARTVHVPLLSVPARDEQPRDDVSHAPNACGNYGGDAMQLCGSPIAWSAGTGLSGIQRVPAGWYHLDPEITDHEPIAARLCGPSW
jgi:hypothetical protein